MLNFSDNDSFWDSIALNNIEPDEIEIAERNSKEVANKIDEHDNKIKMLNFSTNYSFWDSIALNNIEPDEIEIARRNSKEVANKIDEHDNKKCDFRMMALLILLVFIALAVPLAIFLLPRIEEKIKLERRNIIGKNNYMPLFLYVPGTSSSIIPSALSYCSGLTEASLGDNIGNLNISTIKADFITASSLCNVPINQEKEFNIKLFMTLENPILRIPLSYMEMKDPTSMFYDPHLNDVTFEEYVTNTTLFEKDLLTKILLCRDKKNGNGQKLTKYNLNRAKDIFKSSEIGYFRDDYDSFNQFKKAFNHWEFLSLPTVDKCMKRKFKLELNHREELYRKYGIEFSGYVNTMKDASKFDMELYAFIAYSRMNIY